MEIILLIWFLSSVLCAALGAYVGMQKHRDQSEGLLLGFFFGLIGVIVEGLLPTLAEPVPDREMISRMEQRKRQQDRAFLKEQERQREEVLRIEKDRQTAIEAKLREERLELELRCKDNDIDPDSRFIWFQMLPEWSQAIVAGLGCAVPVVLIICLVAHFV